MKVGLIGFGAMAQAICAGWINGKVLLPEQILASDIDFARLESSAAKYGITPVKDNVELCKQADIVVIAVKPDKLEEAMASTQSFLKDKMIISIAVNKDFEAIEAILPETHHVSILPNLPIEVGKGTTVMEQKNSLDQDQLAQFARLFDPVSQIFVLPGEKFRAAGIISGCGPAFAALFAEGLADGGVACGLSRQMAYELSLSMLEGSAALMNKKGLAPALLKDLVCSPAGTTIKGVNTLRKNGFEGDLIEAVEAIWNQ